MDTAIKLRNYNVSQEVRKLKPLATMYAKKYGHTSKSVIFPKTQHRPRGVKVSLGKKRAVSFYIGNDVLDGDAVIEVYLDEKVTQKKRTEKLIEVITQDHLLALEHQLVLLDSGVYHRKETYTIEEVLDKVVLTGTKSNKPEFYATFDGDKINMTSQRYQLAKLKGTQCVTCGIRGKYFAKERTLYDRGYHFNLYAVDIFGNECMITKDHIVRKADGGKDILSNYQPMCYSCNQRKG